MKCNQCGNDKEFYKNMIAEDIYDGEGNYVRTSVGEQTSGIHCMECDSQDVEGAEQV